jgi:uncharacterized membrane protein
MKAREFLSQLQHDAVIKAIGDAEAKTSAEIRVFISRKEPKDAVAAAQDVFVRLGMKKNPKRNGVLLFVAPRVRKFAIIGDNEVHLRCGDAFWQEVAHEMGIARAGKLLAEHFPRPTGDKNPVPKDISQD